MFIIQVSKVATSAEGVASLQGSTEDDRRLQCDVSAPRDDGEQVDADASLGSNRGDNRTHVRDRFRQLPVEEPHDGATAAQHGGHRGVRLG